MNRFPREARKYSVIVCGVPTSIALEVQFYEVLQHIANKSGLTLPQTIRAIIGPDKSAMSSKLRVYCIEYLQGKANVLVQDQTGCLPLPRTDLCQP